MSGWNIPDFLFAADEIDDLTYIIKMGNTLNLWDARVKRIKEEWPIES